MQTEETSNNKNPNERNAGVWTFCFKLLLFTSPVIILLLVYVIADPFKVVRHYDSYYTSHDVEVNILDADYVSTQSFLNHYRQYNYNAFIFGNSRSIFYRSAYWQKYIGQQSCFHFYAYNEGILGIEKKFELLDRLDCPIDNALLILDYETLAGISNHENEHLRVMHPALSSQNWFYFESLFLKDYFDVSYLPVYLRYLVTGKVNDSEKKILSHNPISYSAKENEIHYYVYDSLISSNPEAYYSTHSKFEDRPAKQQFWPKVIADQQKMLLKNIRALFNKKHTKYKVILSPAYDQKKLSAADLNYLQQLFGTENVFDFSGINHITEDTHHYYEPWHYIPSVACEIMDSCYAQK